MAIHWLTTGRTIVVSFPKWRSLSLLLRPTPSCKYISLLAPSSQLQPNRYFIPVRCFSDKKTTKGTAKSFKRSKEGKNHLNEKDLTHLTWWKERLELCRKPSTIQLISRLMFSNLLGVDVNLRNGSLKEGTLNWEILQFKSRFPREVLLCRVGEFYEAIGIDACLLVEYAGLNPFGGLRSDSIPRAGCPVVNLQQTLDDLNRNGYSVCVVEEVQGPTQARSRKERFISGHAHPGSPYVFGHVGVDHDLDFPEPMPVVGISRSAKGYSIILIVETMKTFSVEEGLTEEALVTKLRTCHCHHLFLHSSLKHNTTGTCRWGEFGEGGLLWGECSSRQFEWFEGDPVTDILFKVKDLYGLDDDVSFRNVTVYCDKRPRPLHLGTATQIGVIPTEGIPSLLNVLLPSNCTGLPALYIRDLLLNPPTHVIASRIQAICKLMVALTCSAPRFTCMSSTKLVKLLELREANHIDFCRIKTIVEEVLEMNSNSELRQVLKLLLDPTWVATGLKIDFDTLVQECQCVFLQINEMISLDGESDQEISSFELIPGEFFSDIESSWKGRVKRMHMAGLYAEVEEAAKALNAAVQQDFIPILSRIRASTALLSGPKGEIIYAREHEAVWFKGKRFIPSVWAGTPGEEQIKQLKPSLDSKGKKVGEEWFTTTKVEDALTRYLEANEKAKDKVLELLRGLSAKLQSKINILVFASMLLVIARALFSHVSEGKRRKWIFPTLSDFECSENGNALQYPTGMEITGLLPYWFDMAKGSAVSNSVSMQSLFLLTGPNGGGKSSLLRSVCAAALLGICGLMVPAESALIPPFDAIILHMKSYDSPADGKSLFQVEMSEVRSIVLGATSRSLVLIDEICRGTETSKGTCIAGSVIESLDATGCLGIVSTHLHGIFELPLNTKRTVYKAMGSRNMNGQTIPTWELVDGICRESLAFETAKKEGVPEAVVQRARELYSAVYAHEISSSSSAKEELSKYGVNGESPYEASSMMETRLLSEFVQPELKSADQENIFKSEIEGAITKICKKKLMEVCRLSCESPLPEMKFVWVLARQQPPPSAVGASSVYVLLQPDKKLYVGQTDDLQERVRAHRSKEGLQNAMFIYFLVPGKSFACQLETLLINQLPNEGFHLVNVADGKHRNFGTSEIILESAAATK